MANKKQKVTLRFKDNSFVEQLGDLLLQTGKVKVSGLGIFEIKAVAAREGYNIGDGSTITIPSHNKIAFRPTQKFKDLVQKYTEHE